MTCEPADKSLLHCSCKVLIYFYFFLKEKSLFCHSVEEKWDLLLSSFVVNWWPVAWSICAQKTCQLVMKSWLDTLWWGFLGPEYGKYISSNSWAFPMRCTWSQFWKCFASALIVKINFYSWVLPSHPLSCCNLIPNPLVFNCRKKMLLLLFVWYQGERENLLLGVSSKGR